MDPRILPIAAALDPSDSDAVALEPRVFGTREPPRILGLLDAACRAHLGGGIREVHFYAASTGCVAGVTLDGGEARVLKAHRPGRADRLAACQAVQGHLADRGFPAPRPQLGPTPLEGAPGVVTAESALFVDGPTPRADDPETPRRLAEALFELVTLATDAPGAEALGASWFSGLPAAQRWPRPHSPLFDFSAPAEDPGWVDALADAARATPLAGRRVVGHFDWRVEHLRARGETVSAVFDWDSLHLDHEPVVVGCAAHAFTANWSDEDPSGAPSPAQIEAFFAAYERARGAPFDPAERRVRDAALVYATAYTCRCTLCFAPESRSPEAQSFLRLLEAHGQRWLLRGR